MKSTKALKKSKYLIVAMVLLLAIIFTYISFNQSIAFAAENDPYDPFDGEEKKYDTTTIDEDFEDSCVMIVITQKQSEVNKSHNGKFRLVSNIESIEDLTSLTGNIDDKEYLDRENFHQILKINLANKSKQNVLNMIRKIEDFSGVLWAGPSKYASMDETDITAEDTNGISSNFNTQAEVYSTFDFPPAAYGSRFKQQWGLDGDFGINATRTWLKHNQGSKSVKVGVIDTGIADHPDLKDNVVEGWDFVNNEAKTNDDPNGHGTHVAGIIGASGASANGVVGVNWNVTLVPLQVVEITTNSKGEIEYNFPWYATIAAINWATDNNLNILNYSGGSYDENPEVKTAIANFKGLFVCSAGNKNWNNDNNPSFYHYPSEYSRDKDIGSRVISVGAMDINGYKSSDSNYGNMSVSIFAPGEDILSTVPISTKNLFGYENKSGTSMATPFVTGVAALLFNEYKSNKFSMLNRDIAKHIKSMILNNCNKDNDFIDLCVAGGYLNAEYPFDNMSLREDVAGELGFVDGRYKWTGRVDLLISNPDSYYISSNGDVCLEVNTDLNFKIVTTSKYNAWTEISGTIKITLKNSAGEVVQINGKEAHTTKVSVGLTSNATVTGSSFTIMTDNLKADTYTLYFTSKFTRNGIIYSKETCFIFNNYNNNNSER